MKELKLIQDSPFQKAIKFLKKFFSKAPTTQLNNDHSNNVCVHVASHSIQLIEASGTLNTIGYHTAAMSLFRQIEDSLDVFVCCGLIPEKAQEWQNDNLRPSGAAKEWIPFLEEELGESDKYQSFSEYRKNIRHQFNKYSHCSPFLINWNLKETKSNQVSVQITPKQIPKNAIVIDSNLIFAQYEFLYLLTFVYKNYLNDHPKIQKRINKLLDEMYPIIKEMEDKSYYTMLNFPPELENVKDQLPRID